MRIGFEVSNVTMDQPIGIARSIIALISALAGQLETRDHLTLFYKLSRWQRRQQWWRLPGLQVRLYHGRWWPPVKGVEILHGLDGVIPPWSGVTQVYVTHLGIDQHFWHHVPEATQQVLQSYELVPGYLLFVGAISGRKNTARLVQAYARARASKERPLVLVGAMSYRGEDTLEAIQQCGLGQHVRLVGYVPDKDLPALYAGAACFVFPTLYEGFGMPILEAMASGTSVLTSTTGAAPEIGGGLAVSVDP